MLWRALLAFLALPGMVAFAVPLWLASSQSARGGLWPPGGPYRFSRNPMYIGVVVVLLGWAALFRSRTLLIYAAALALAVHVRVVFAEDPWARRTFGADWEHYQAQVPRWFL